MIAMNLGPDVIVPVVAFAIPIVAIVGGITAGIVRTLGQQRMIELAQRERIAAIEKGIDPAKLPPMGGLDTDALGGLYLSPADRDRRRSQGLMVGGIITLFAGIGVSIFLFMLISHESEPVWAAGLIPTLVGIGLLLSAWLVRPRG
ncbi:MAG: hypothetical protein A2W00_02180 [Candidatus Eisenbacteria bacterium RBG_16_71_46]|nr:MAG: hypothetical protein A2W00_02180 [Candidatus Eisenbacteria bacterium RBG_16_71_46]OGF20997.1 MAG: hypothetical protein A2V63_02285 [Candidatus Eisenbacteria bacterium RBG_19FT_COMBO_70_11]